VNNFVDTAAALLILLYLGAVLAIAMKLIAKLIGILF